MATDRGAFWVGGETHRGPLGTVLRGPMYVEWEAPSEPRGRFVLVHGGGGQGTDYLVTPDGRPGWARLLVEQGHEVFVVDRPGHGRSPHDPSVLGPMGPSLGAEFLAPMFLPDPGDADAHPSAALHTQWPGGRTFGDPVFEQWLSAAGPMLADFGTMQRLERARLVELLERVGPSVLVAHSAGGPGAFLAADARPDLVRALVAIETMGPPFAKRPEMGLDLAWGVAAAPLTYDPPITDPAELRLTEADPPERSPMPMVIQQEPARRLANLSQFPIAVVTAEASPFQAFDHHLVAHLDQAGCEVDLIRLGEHGVHGNGHGMMLERNHADVLEVITSWLDGRAALGAV